MEKVPLTKQLVDQLEAFIKEKLQPNDKLPSERDLSELYHVSRNTVRSALNELFLRGFIYRSTGKGTFVAERFDERTDVSGSYSFTKQMLAMNRQPVTKIQRLEKSRYRLTLPNGCGLIQRHRFMFLTGCELRISCR